MSCEHIFLATARLQQQQQQHCLAKWSPQDAPETIEKVLGMEQDLSTRRNAFAMLSAHAVDRATRYLFEHLEQVATWGDILQMAVLDLIRKASTQIHTDRLECAVQSVSASCWLCVAMQRVGDMWQQSQSLQLRTQRTKRDD
jgi:hypothetical protein